MPRATRRPLSREEDDRHLRPVRVAAGLLVGADDYIVKPFNADELLARARAAVRRITARPQEAGTASPSIGASLTSREREVLRLLARGLTQTAIAGELFISPKTVGGHIQRVLTKLNVHSRVQAVALAHEHSLHVAEEHGAVAAVAHLQAVQASQDGSGEVAPISA